jgi:hypothetical protein
MVKAHERNLSVEEKNQNEKIRMGDLEFSHRLLGEASSMLERASKSIEKNPNLKFTRNEIDSLYAGARRIRGRIALMLDDWEKRSK